MSYKPPSVSTPKAPAAFGGTDKMGATTKAAAAQGNAQKGAQMAYQHKSQVADKPLQTKNPIASKMAAYVSTPSGANNP